LVEYLHRYHNICFSLAVYITLKPILTFSIICKRTSLAFYSVVIFSSSKRNLIQQAPPKQTVMKINGAFAQHKQELNC